jgi:membrane protease YdiL (CAAX protease family)
MAFLDIPAATLVTSYALVIAFAFPFADLAKMRKLQQQTSAPARLSAYRYVVIFLWIAAAIAIILVPPRMLFTVARSPADFGWLYAHPWALGLSMLLAGLLLALVVAPGLQCIRNHAVRQKIAKAMQDMRFLLPVSKVERHWWLVLSVSAGVCEELLYRGFLLEFLRGRLDGGPQLGLTAAWLLSSIAFGTAHLYQGVAGIIKTTVVGLLLGMLAILSGSLLLPIICHILFDAQILWMYRPADDAPDQAQRLVNGCEPGCGQLSANTQ